MKHTYKTKGTCSTKIEFELDGNIVKNVVYTGGCEGNLQAIPRLVEGMTVDDIVQRCSGINCGFRKTSCADQLAIAVKEAYERENSK